MGLRDDPGPHALRSIATGLGQRHHRGADLVEHGIIRRDAVPQAIEQRLDGCRAFADHQESERGRRARHAVGVTMGLFDGVGAAAVHEVAPRGFEDPHLRRKVAGEVTPERDEVTFE